MSYKRKPENIAFSINVTPDKKKKFESEETISVAVLAPFNPFPKISFENIKLHIKATREVYIVNPTENALQVELTKLPDEARGYQWSATNFELPKESQIKLVIYWTPSEYGSWHDNVKIVNKKTKKTLSELKLSSTTEEPPKVSKQILRPTGVLTKKHGKSSKQALVKKSPTSKTKSENKENEVTLMCKSNKQTLGKVCIQNENVIIFDSKKLSQNKTFTRINESDLDDSFYSKKSEECVQTTTAITSQNSNRLQLGPSTPRRGTYEVIEPVMSSRRSTYSLQNRQISNILDLENEKREFELLASPNILNDSLEKAASKIIAGQQVKIEHATFEENEEFEVVDSNCIATTFTIQPSTTLNNDFDFPSSSNTVSSSQLLIDNQILECKKERKLSLESVISSEKFYDSLEERQSHDFLDRSPELSCKKKEDFLVDWDEVYDIDKFTSRSEKPHVKRDSALERFKKDECSSSLAGSSPKEDYLSYCKETFPGQFHSSSNHIVLESQCTNENITHCRKQRNTFYDSFFIDQKQPENECVFSPKISNQTKHSLLNFDEEFGKFNFSIVSSSPVNTQNKLSNEINNTYTSAMSRLTSDNFELPESCSQRNLDEENNRFRKNLNLDINDSGSAKVRHMEKHFLSGNFKHTSEHTTENNPLNGPQNSFIGQQTETGVQTKNCFSTATTQPEIMSLDVSNDSKANSVKWNISPPIDGNDKICEMNLTRNVSKLKTLALYTPDRLTRSKLGLTNRIPKIDNSQLTNTKCLPVNPTTPSESFISKKCKTDMKNFVQPELYTKEVFLVPARINKRSSVQKNMNVTPPKIRKFPQEVKIKRLSTPLMSRKLPITSMTEERKIYKIGDPKSTSRSAISIRKRKSLKVTDWVPAVRRLKLTSTSSQSAEDISTSSVDLTTPDPYLAATTLNPFAKGGLFFNNKWLKEQEVELIQWADRMLRPPSELQLDRDQTEHSTLHRLNALRATAFNILTSTEVATVLSKVKIAVDRNIISIRSDRQLHADLGLQDKIISLLMIYNPLWLRLCLEVVYQCNIQLKCHSDQNGLRDFIRRYVLNDDYLRRKHSHPTIPYLMLPPFEDEMKKFTVYKFLVIVYLLDLVKRKKLILHDPCLFKKDSKLKSSKEVLLDFNKDFVASAGDITRILRLRGYEVSHYQTYIDEFDFSLSSITELRDGVRLTRLAEHLICDNSLCSKLRAPAVSNLQKKFNAEVAFSALKKAGHDLPSDVIPKDISDGHNEKTLSFLWHLRSIFQKHAVLLIITKWRETKQLRMDRKKFLKMKNSAIQIQRWYRKIKRVDVPNDEELNKGCEAREHFLKLRAVVVHLQRIFRKKKEERDQKKKFKAATVIQNWYRNQKCVSKDRSNFNAIKKAVTIIQRAFRKFKSEKYGSGLEERLYFLKIRAFSIMIQKRVRLNKLGNLQRQQFLATKTAAIKIQRQFRANNLAKTVRNRFLTIKKATVTIQRRFRAYLTSKTQRNDFINKKAAVILIQKQFRAYKQAKTQRQEFLKIKTATVIIQTKYRYFLLAKYHRQEFLQLKTATVTIQRRFRDKREIKRCRESFLAVKKATSTLQRRFRASLLAKHEREQFLEKKRAVIILQRRYRSNKIVKHQRERFLAIKTATVTIQRKLRANKLAKIQRESFLTLKYTAIILQRRFRLHLLTKHQNKEFLTLKSAAIIIQRRFKANVLAKHHRQSFLILKSAVLTIQRQFRCHHLAYQQRQVYIKMKSSAILIQRKYRAYKLAKQQRKEFITLKMAVVVVQRKFRNLQTTKMQRQNFLSYRTAVTTVQRTFRANKESKNKRAHFVEIRNATIKIQRKFKAFLLTKEERKNFLALKAAAIVIQRLFKAKKLAENQRKEFLSIKVATLTIQRRFRSSRLVKQHRQDFLKIKSAALTIQKMYTSTRKAKFTRKQFLVLKNSTIILQKRFRAMLLANQQRKDYLKLKTTVIKIQRRFRSRKQTKMLQEHFTALKTAAGKIQRRFREAQLVKQQRQEFLSLKMATILIQRKYRGNKLGNQQREKYTSMKLAAVQIQRRFRSLLLTRQERNNFISTKNAAIKLQRMVRARNEVKSQREHFLKVKNAAITIQRRYRLHMLACRERKVFLAMKANAIKVQNRFRALRLANKDRNHFLNIRTAAIKIQTRFRAFLIAKDLRQEFLEKKAAVLTIQRKFKAVKLAKMQRKSFLALKSATVTIQRQFRALLIMKLHRQEFISLKSATTTIQRLFTAKNLAKYHRQNSMRLKEATTMIEDPSIAREHNAALQIQAFWRGYLVRKTVTIPQPLKTKPTFFKASTDDQAISTRGQHYFRFLFSHRKYSVAELQNTLFNIDKITVLSANQCEYFVKNGAVKILYDILKHQSNRAFGVHTCVELVLSILLNFYRAPITAGIVWKETTEVNGIFHVFDLMMRFKSEKSSTVFCKACTVIWLFAQDPTKAEVIMNTPKVQDTYKYIVKSMKKNEQPGSSGLTRPEQTRSSNKKPLPATRKKLPALRFNCGGYFNDHRAFEDKLFALNSLIDKLGRFIK